MGRSVSSPYDAQIIAYDHIEYEDEYDDWSYDDFVDDVRYRAEALWPSLSEDNGWAGREDRIILSNDFAQFGVSEYCGLVAIWVRVDPAYEREALAQNWIDNIAPKFNAEFGELRKIGTASNGESFFERCA